MNSNLHPKPGCLLGVKAEAGDTAFLWYVGAIMRRRIRGWGFGIA